MCCTVFSLGFFTLHFYQAVYDTPKITSSPLSMYSFYVCFLSRDSITRWFCFGTDFLIALLFAMRPRSLEG